MFGIMDYSIRIICRECGGKHIPYDQEYKKKAAGVSK
jgi:hypothetical protein